MYHSFLWHVMPLILCIFVCYMKMNCFVAIQVFVFLPGVWKTFLSGGIDLRSLFIHPENKHEYFDVVFQTGQYQHERLMEKSLPEDKLPAEDIYCQEICVRMW